MYLQEHTSVSWCPGGRSEWFLRSSYPVGQPASYRNSQVEHETPSGTTTSTSSIQRWDGIWEFHRHNSKMRRRRLDIFIWKYRVIPARKSRKTPKDNQSSIPCQHHTRKINPQFFFPSSDASLVNAVSKSSTRHLPAPTTADRLVHRSSSTSSSKQASIDRWRQVQDSPLLCGLGERGREERRNERQCGELRPTNDPAANCSAKAFDNRSIEARAGISYTNTGIPLDATGVNPTVP